VASAFHTKVPHRAHCCRWLNFCCWRVLGLGTWYSALGTLVPGCGQWTTRFGLSSSLLQRAGVLSLLQPSNELHDCPRSRGPEVRTHPHRKVSNNVSQVRSHLGSLSRCHANWAIGSSSFIFNLPQINLSPSLSIKIFLSLNLKSSKCFTTTRRSQDTGTCPKTDSNTAFTNQPTAHSHS
jgi:hypothetical protein